MSPGYWQWGKETKIPVLFKNSEQKKIYCKINIKIFIVWYKKKIYVPILPSLVGLLQ